MAKPTEFEEESLNITADMDEGENSDMVGQFPVRIELLLSSIKKCYIEGRFLILAHKFTIIL